MASQLFQIRPSRLLRHVPKKNERFFEWVAPYYDYLQLQIRTAEISRALDVLESLNRGEIEGSELPLSLPLHAFEGKINCSRPALVGHSFGGASALLVLARDQRFK